MDFQFTPEQEAWRDKVRAFFKGTITDDLLDEVRESRDPFSFKLWKRLAEEGYLGMTWPKSAGGLERSHWDQLIFQQEALKLGCPAGILSLMSDINLAGNSILHYGSDDQRERFIPSMLRGEMTAAEGLTEPEAGSDLTGLQTRAVRNGDTWTLNGSKIFNLAHLTTHFFVLARTDPTVTNHRGLSFFLVDMHAPGVQVTPLRTIGGWRRNVVYFEDVQVPHSMLVGEENRGWYQYVAPHGGAASVHVLTDAQRAFHELLYYVKANERDGVRLADIPPVRQLIGDLASDMRAVELLTWKVGSLNEHKQDATKLAAMCHTCGSEMQERILSAAMDILGPEAALESWGADLPGVPLRGILPELYRTTRVWFIAGGTNEIKRNIIAQRGLGLPRG